MHSGDIFTEYKQTYFGERKAYECLLAEKNENEVVLIYEISKPMNFSDTLLPAGSKSYGYFWANKNYNVYHWRDPSNSTIFFYFNISKNTKILESSVTWEDLIVDVLAFPNGKFEILDEHELPSTISQADKMLIDETKSEILASLQKTVEELERRTSCICGLGAFAEKVF